MLSPLFLILTRNRARKSLLCHTYKNKLRGGGTGVTPRHGPPPSQHGKRLLLPLVCSGSVNATCSREAATGGGRAAAPSFTSLTSPASSTSAALSNFCFVPSYQSYPRNLLFRTLILLDRDSVSFRSAGVYTRSTACRCCQHSGKD